MFFLLLLRDRTWHTAELHDSQTKAESNENLLRVVCTYTVQLNNERMLAT